MFVIALMNLLAKYNKGKGTMVEHEEQKEKEKVFKDEIKRLKEQLDFAIQLGNKLTVLGIPLLSRNTKYREDEKRDFGKASSTWWKFVAVAKSIKKG